MSIKNKYRHLTLKEKDRLLHLKDKEIQMISVKPNGKRMIALKKESSRLRKRNSELSSQLRLYKKIYGDIDAKSTKV